MLNIITSWFSTHGFDPALAELMARGATAASILVVCIIANFVAKHLIVRGLGYLISQTENQRDDIFMERKVLSRLAHFAPAVVVYLLAPVALEGYESLITLMSNIIFIYMIFLGMLFIDSLLNALVDIYRTFDASRNIPIKSFVQIAKLVVFLIGTIFIISIILGKTPLYLISGLGALTAVLMLVFKDTLLGFVAGIQLTTNKMLARGDWLEMPKHNADGVVLDVTLTTVKVQNWDKTITTVPTYALISESFKNWRGMSESAGRRIKRAIYIDINSIKLCDDAMLKRFQKITLIGDYLDTKINEITAYNKNNQIGDDALINGRRLTNVGTFRAYVEAYLKEHPLINKNMTFLVRQLAPTEHGLPIEIYVFCRDKVWRNYEAIQADIFDHLLAVAPEFDLRVFQIAAGSDFRAAIQAA